VTILVGQDPNERGSATDSGITALFARYFNRCKYSHLYLCISINICV